MIKTFEEACQALGLDPQAVPVVTGLPEKHQNAIVAHYKLVIVAEALNEGWQPDWINWSEYKYYPWFEIEGDGFSYVTYYDWFTNTGVGSRLCYRTSELALYAAKQFEDLYKAYLII